MNLGDPRYDFHELQQSYISLYFSFEKLNLKLGTLRRKLVTSCGLKHFFSKNRMLQPYAMFITCYCDIGGYLSGFII